MNEFGAVLSALGGLLCIALVFWVHSANEAQLDDPQDTRVVPTDTLPGLVSLVGDGVFRVTIYRQSGNPHSEREWVGPAAGALDLALATMRRAKIDSVRIKEDSPDRLYVVRLHHNHRGSSEGKKVGGFEIVRICHD